MRGGWIEKASTNALLETSELSWYNSFRVWPPFLVAWGSSLAFHKITHLMQWNQSMNDHESWEWISSFPWKLLMLGNFALRMHTWARCCNCSYMILTFEGGDPQHVSIGWRLPFDSIVSWMAQRIIQWQATGFAKICLRIRCWYHHSFWLHPWFFS